MDIFETTEQLIQEELIMIRSQIIIRLNHLMKIRLHQLKHDVNIPELSTGRRQHNMLNLHNIRMLKQPQQLNLPENPGCVRDMLKDVVDLLDSNSLASVCV